MDVHWKQKFYPFFLLCALGFTWGTSFSIAKFAMQSGITPLGYSFWQTLGPAILVSCVTLLREKGFLKNLKKHSLFYFFCGLLGICLPNLSMYFSALHVSSGLLALIVNTSPIITYGLSIVFFIERFDFIRLTGVVLAVFGIFLCFYPRLDQHQIDATLWLLFAFATPILLSLCTIFLVKCRPQHISSLSLSAGMLIAATVLTAPVTIQLHQFHPLSSWNLPNLFVGIEIILSSLGYILFFELLKVAGPIYYSLVGCIVSLSGLLWGYVIFHEQPAPAEWAAVLLIISAIFLVSSSEVRSSSAGHDE